MKEDYGFFEKYWIICIAVIIACINIGCRIKDGIANQNYEIAEGMVTSITSETATIEIGDTERDIIILIETGKFIMPK